MTTPAGDPPGPGPYGAPPASAGWALGLCAAVGWFFIGSAAFATGPLQALPWLFVDGMVPNPLLIAVLGAFAVLGFLASLLPLGARWSREQVAARAALTTIVAGAALRLLFSVPAQWGSATLSILGMTLAFAGTAAGALFLNAVIGLINRRALAGGFVGAILLRHLELVIPASWALLPLGVVLVAGLFLLARWRAAPVEDRGDSFERRAGGLRLRGALAFGALLFFELTYGLPGMADTSPPGEAGFGAALKTALGMVPLAIAWLYVVRGLSVARHRFLAVSLSVILTAGAIYPFLGAYEFWIGAVAAVLAQAAAFLLFGRALAPASGRRSGRKLATGLALFLLLTIAHAATLVSTEQPISLDHGRLGRIMVAIAAGAVLAVAMYLTPRPALVATPLPDRWLFRIAAALPAIALLAALL